MTMRLSVHRASWPMTARFVITGHVFDSLEAVVVAVEQDGKVGRGEGVPVYYLQERSEEMLEQIEAIRPAIEAGVSRSEIQELLPHGGARNAVDCALWDLAGQKAGYLKKQLQDFKTGKRQDPMMSGLAKPLSSTDIENLAAYYSSLK